MSHKQKFIQYRSDPHIFLSICALSDALFFILHHYPSSHIIRDGQVFKGAELEHHTGVEETVHTL